MSQTHSCRAAWVKPASQIRTDKITRFPMALKLGPYKLMEVGIDLAVIDLGGAAIDGDDVDLSPFAGRQLFLRSAPKHLSLSSLSREGRYFLYPFYSYDRSWVATEGDFERYLGSFSKTSRKSLKRRVKQLTAVSGGHLDIRHYDHPDIMAAFHTDARTISVKTFQEQLMDDGLPADKTFQRAMAQRSRNGQCYGSILYLENTPVSYLYCERQGEGWLAVYGGFDPAYARLSPGTVHLVSLLERSFEDADCAFFDLGPGNSGYKRVFATHGVPCSDVLVLEDTVRNRLMTRTYGALTWLTGVFVFVAETLGVKRIIRQVIRGR